MATCNDTLGYSICIPVFNQCVRPLVTELHQQALRLGVPFELLLMDDCSTLHKEENRSLQSLAYVDYIELAENIGRSAIRNKLAERAQYDTLIIMDCDALVPSPHYLENYLQQQGKPVVIGGCAYPDTPPEMQENALRWFYGKAREERPASQRNRHPHDSFTPFNLMIQKEILLSVRFDESLKGYGHEDTLFGWQLKKAGIPVSHIDNPLIHNHQDKNSLFLQKSEEATIRLWQIYERMGDEKLAFAEDIKSLKCFALLQRMHLDALAARCIALAQKTMVANLLSQKPNIRLLDLLKILWLYRAQKEECII